MTLRTIEGLDEFRDDVEAQQRLTEDYAAARVLPGCTGVLDMLDRLERIHARDPEEARTVYFRWKAACGRTVMDTTSLPRLRTHRISGVRQCPRCRSGRFTAEVIVGRHGPVMAGEWVTCANCGREALWGQETQRE